MNGVFRNVAKMNSLFALKIDCFHVIFRMNSLLDTAKKNDILKRRFSTEHDSKTSSRHNALLISLVASCNLDDLPKTN